MRELTPDFLRPLLLHRQNDSHKGNYGHLLLICGSDRYSGAAVLATGAALKSGCGLVTLHSPARALQATVNRYPSAMLSEDPSTCFSIVPERLERFSAIAVGPGLGQAPQTLSALENLLDAAQAARIPMVLDADALNLIANNARLLAKIPDGSVMTPHAGELKRQIESISPGEDEEPSAQDLCSLSGCVMVLKGWHSKILTPEGEVFENSTGNPGMAKGGSGDVLTGLIGGLLARGYCARDAALLGTWIHGCAGDALTAARTAEAYSSRDLIDTLDEGFRTLYLR